MIMSGGAVAAACDQLAQRLIKIGAALLQAKLGDVRLHEGFISGPRGRIAIHDVARTYYRRPQDLPGDVDPGGLEVTAGYKAKRDSGTFSYAAHAAVVAVDPDTGEVEILDYLVVEDGGVLVNPMIVDGQIWGGTAQGIGTALYEEMTYDTLGQPLASTLSDYLLPGPAEVPEIRILHMETASPYTRVRPEGSGRRRRHRAARGHHQRHQRCPGRPRRRTLDLARHTAAHRRGRRPSAEAGGEGYLMKAARFDYLRPTSLPEALALIAEAPDAKVMAGGQTLGPMLNLRLAQPSLLIDIARIAELAEVAEDADSVTLGATITHAAIEDGCVRTHRRLFSAGRRRHRLSRRAHARHHRRQPRPRRSGGGLARRPDRARCRPELARARPPAPPRAQRLRRAARCETVLKSNELITGVRLAKFSHAARFGYHKICRKVGEFADAIGAAVYDPERGASGGLPSAPLTGAPLVLEPRLDGARGRAEIVRLEDDLRQAGACRRCLRDAAARRGPAARHNRDSWPMTAITLTVNGKPL